MDRTLTRRDRCVSSTDWHRQLGGQSRLFVLSTGRSGHAFSYTYTADGRFRIVCWAWPGCVIQHSQIQLLTAGSNSATTVAGLREISPTATPRRQHTDTVHTQDIKTIKHKTRKKYEYSLQNRKSRRKSNGKIFEYRTFYRVSSIVRAQTIFRA